MHRRMSGLTKSDDFSNARVEGAIMGDYERQWITDNVPRIQQIILHADSGLYIRKIVEMNNLRFKVVDQGHLMSLGTMINAVIETLTR